MKKFLLYLIVIITICFIIPAILTKKRTLITSENNIINIQKDDVKVDESINKDDLNYEYKKYGTIKLLHSETKQIEELAIDDYLCNVVSAEMPATYETAALEAQAIVARTYTIYKALNKKHENADICDDSKCCQAWISKEDRMACWDESDRDANWQKVCNAVNNTKGKIITYNNLPINAFFHANSGGSTEIPINVWGGTDYPYLQSVETSGEEGYSQFLSEVTLFKEDLFNKLKDVYSDISINFDNNEDIKILEYTETGRVKTVKFGNYNLSGTETRKILDLKSTNFQITKEGDNYKFTVKGYGHGVGMSQTGADALAKQGKNYEEIIKHFYSGVEISYI